MSMKAESGININVNTGGSDVSNQKDDPEFDLTDGINTIDEARYDMESKKLSTRKKMAWFSLSGILGVLIGCFVMYFWKSFDIERFNTLRPLIETCVFSLTSVVGFFIGSQTFADSKWSKDSADQQ